jgi:hypothetical protein
MRKQKKDLSLEDKLDNVQRCVCLCLRLYVCVRHLPTAMAMGVRGVLMPLMSVAASQDPEHRRVPAADAHPQAGDG